MQPRRISPQMRDAVAVRLALQPVRRDWPMLFAIGSGLAAACVIVAMLIEQMPAVGPRPFGAHPVVAVTPQDPPAIYAFNFANNSWLEESRRVR
jgi:hypothetical protein